MLLLLICCLLHVKGQTYDGFYDRFYDRNHNTFYDSNCASSCIARLTIELKLGCMIDFMILAVGYYLYDVSYDAKLQANSDSIRFLAP